MSSNLGPIVGMPTAVTAFVDFFARGPIDRPVQTMSLRDVEREFGSLDARSEASYGLVHYFQNGGQIAWIVRVVSPDARRAERMLTRLQGAPSLAAPSSDRAFPDEVLTVRAANPGAWGNRLQVAIDYHAVALVDGAPRTFNLAVREVTRVGGRYRVQAVERYLNLGVDPTGARYVETMVNRDSRLITVSASGAGLLPAPTGIDSDGLGDQALWLWLGQAGYQQGTVTSQALAEWGTVNFVAGDDGITPDMHLWRQSMGAAVLLGTAGTPAPVNRGIYELDTVGGGGFNLLCLPGAAHLSLAGHQAVYTAAAQLCQAQRAFLFVDIPPSVVSVADMIAYMHAPNLLRTSYGAVYFPRLSVPDPLETNARRLIGPSGALAGVFARTDASRGVWKAPAGADAVLHHIETPLKITDGEQGMLNQLGVNVVRSFPGAPAVVWGARTLDGADVTASEWKYIPVRRLALHIEESLSVGLDWVRFEPNGVPVWSLIRQRVEAFLHQLFQMGAFAGRTPQQAYFVICDSDTTAVSDAAANVVRVLVGFAPLRPAEFIILTMHLNTA